MVNTSSLSHSAPAHSGSVAGLLLFDGPVQLSWCNGVLVSPPCTHRGCRCCLLLPAVTREESVRKNQESAPVWGSSCFCPSMAPVVTFIYTKAGETDFQPLVQTDVPGVERTWCFTVRWIYGGLFCGVCLMS